MHVPNYWMENYHDLFWSDDNHNYSLWADDKDEDFHNYDYYHMCHDDWCGEGETCCHDFEMGMSYCCSDFTRYIYIALMLGAGLVVGLLILICYLCLRRAERSLEERARIEAMKSMTTAVLSPTGMPVTDLRGAALCAVTSNNPNLRLPPPSYDAVMSPARRIHSSCHTRDTQRTPASPTHMLGRPNSIDSIYEQPRLHEYQYAGSQSAVSRYTHNYLAPLPPPSPSDSIDKLPTYNECASHVADGGIVDMYSPTRSPARQNVTRLETMLESPMRELREAFVVKSETDMMQTNCNSNHNSISNKDGEIQPEQGSSPSPFQLQYQLSTPIEADDGTGIVTGRMHSRDSKSIDIETSSAQEIEVNKNNNDNEDIGAGVIGVDRSDGIEVLEESETQVLADSASSPSTQESGQANIDDGDGPEILDGTLSSDCKTETLTISSNGVDLQGQMQTEAETQNHENASHDHKVTQKVKHKEDEK